MMYFTLKLVHIISSTILFGTGLGIAFFMFTAVRSQNLAAIQITSQYVVLADYVFTAPAVVMQLISGLLLMHLAGLTFDSAWFYLVIALYVFIGCCWLPVVYIQIKLRNLANGAEINDQFRRLFRLWLGLGVPAFIAVLLLFYLMVFRAVILN